MTDQTTVLIARHGNTFAPGEPVRRVGRRTDLPLSHSGEQQALQLGHYLRTHYPQLSLVYSSPLQRARSTAELAMAAMGCSIPLIIDTRLTEIDYGIDDGKPETQVQARIGEAALAAWNERNEPPPGWLVDVTQMINEWRALLTQITHEHAGETILVVTSNGTARFVKQLIDPQDSRSAKLATGALACLVHAATHPWHIQFWNRRPADGASQSTR